MKNVSIFTPEIRVLCQRSFTEPLRNFTPRLEENEKAREKALKKERTFFFSHLPMTVQQKTPFTTGLA